MTESPYLVEIDYPSLTEMIDERFDSITALMPSNAVIYGSSLTSLISGLPADGDLDIAISHEEYPLLAQSLQASSKWLQIEGEHVKEPRSGRNEWGLSFSPGWKKTTRSGYKDIPGFPLEETVTFQDINKSKVQIIKSKQSSGDPLDDSLSVVRKVDFAFCGMALDKYGRLIESIPHAYSDCCAGIIRIANYRAGDDPKRVRGRIEKYLRRGWSLSVSMDTIFETLRKLSEKAKEIPEELPAGGREFVLTEIYGKTVIKANGFSTSLSNRQWIDKRLNDIRSRTGFRFSIEIAKGECILVPLDSYSTTTLILTADRLNRMIKTQDQPVKQHIPAEFGEWSFADLNAPEDFEL